MPHQMIDEVIFVEIRRANIDLGALLNQICHGMSLPLLPKISDFFYFYISRLTAHFIKFFL
jgi:hypothetical protein